MMEAGRISDRDTHPRRAWWRAALKVALSAAAIWFVTRKIDLEETLALMRGMHPGWYVLALLAFNTSKLWSTLRLKILLGGIGVRIAHAFNIRLLYVGSFFNLFLPGSVGGDGYKVVLLREAYGTSHRQLISAVLLDRVNGLVALVAWTALMMFIGDVPLPIPVPRWSLVAAIPLCYVAYEVVLRKWFASFTKRSMATHVVSLCVQALQVVCAWCLLRALGITDLTWSYLILFMLTSVAAVFPFTIGGLGARELVMVYFGPALGVDVHGGVALSLAFFSVLALSALPGLAFTFWPVKRVRPDR